MFHDLETDHPDLHFELGAHFRRTCPFCLHWDVCLWHGTGFPSVLQRMHTFRPLCRGTRTAQSMRNWAALCFEVELP
jgi:hypothetical protein